MFETVGGDHWRARALAPLPLGAIRPAGWLRDQLRIQAAGLSGHLDEFWPDVAESAWIGGRAEGWERGPYWLDGVVPLAYLLDDAPLKDKVARWVNYILEHQQADGWLGSVHDARYGYQYDPWPRFVVLKALTQYQEATGDARVIPAIARFLRRLDTLLDTQPLTSWAYYRWADLLVSVYWLYERAPAGWLLRLVAKVRAQGFDWRAYFADFHDTGKTPRDACALSNHGVNIAMGLKAPGVWARQSGAAGDREAIFAMLAALDRHHGQATGVFTCDEHLAGRNPSQGTELCSVVEMMYSLEVLLAALGDPRLGDRLERIAFNALPATFTPDMWAHQYDQQANQVICRVAEDSIWTNNGPEANIFGLAPNFGCCTANMHQGWPKLASHLWMRAPDAGLAAVAYAPSSVALSVAGQPVRVDLATDYPFADTLHFTIRAERPVRFPLHLRIPAWAEAATVQIGEGAPTPVAPGTFHRIEQEWPTDAQIALRLPMPVTATRGYHDSIALVRGPLVYSLPIGEDWRLVGGAPPHGDWEVYPTTAWNYGLAIDPDHLEQAVQFQTAPIGSRPFSPEGAPVRAHVRGRRVPGWALEHNAAGELPSGVVAVTTPTEELTLIPYGCTNLRVTEFPLVSGG